MKAIDALQRGELRVWLSLFVKNAVVYDHGNVMTAGEFIEKSAGREYFTRIDRVGDTGLSVVGSYHTEQWGDFLVSFRFYLAGGGVTDCGEGGTGESREVVGMGEAGKSGRRGGGDRICRLDVLQVAY